MKNKQKILKANMSFELGLHVNWEILNKYKIFVSKNKEK